MHVIEEGILTQLCCKIHMHAHELSLTRSTQWLVVFYTTFLFPAVMVVGRVHGGGGVAVPEPVHAACALRRAGSYRRSRHQVDRDACRLLYHGSCRVSWQGVDAHRHSLPFLRPYCWSVCLLGMAYPSTE
jgi:hypothetical protein